MTPEDLIEDLKTRIEELEQSIVERDSTIDSLKTNIEDAIYYLNKG